MSKKNRLDLLVNQQFPEYSRRIIQSWIMQGKVKVNGVPVLKPGTLFASDVILSVDAHEPKYVSRAGFKLEKALDYFHIDPKGLVVLDAGLSTGGFADCLLQRGAAKIYGVDVGYGQVHEKIRTDKRVVVLERTNLRELHSVGQLVDLITLDLSFISILKVMDAVTALVKPNGQLLTLIKPQFEAKKEEVERGGLITNPKIHQRIITEVIAGIENYGFACKGYIESPIAGTTGNKEFLAYFVRK